MSEPAQTSSQDLPISAKRSKTAFTLGVTGLFVVVLAPFALLLSLLELCRQKQRKYQDAKARRLAWMGLMLSVVAITLWAFVFYYGYKRAQQVVCNIHLFYGIQNAVAAYQNDFKALPTPEQWCDLLIEYADYYAEGFRCPTSDAVKGESSYALNKHLFDVPCSQLPGDIVFLFETDSGKENGPRIASIQDRAFFSFLRERGGSEFLSLADNKVFPTRWNQIGGPEDAVARHFGKCHVVLLNSTIKAVKPSDLHTLRWTPD